MSGITCDWCAAQATRITVHVRVNTGPLEAYWCERHYAAATSPQLTLDLDEDAPA